MNAEVKMLQTWLNNTYGSNSIPLTSHNFFLKQRHLCFIIERLT